MALGECKKNPEMGKGWLDLMTRLEKSGFVISESQRLDTRLDLKRVLIGRKERIWIKTSSISATILADEEEKRPFLWPLADLGAFVLVLEQEDIAEE